MQVSVETTQGLGRKMTVALPSEDIDSAVTERLQSLSKTARLNGFRPGKVPFKVVKKRFEPQVRVEVLGSLINQGYQDAIKQEELRPASQPEIELDEQGGEDASAVSFVATFEVYPEIDPQYDDRISVERPVVDIEESDVDEMIESLRKQRTDYVTVERAAADGDQVIIDFAGKIDNEPFEGGKAEKAPLVLGSGAMIDGFESALIGVVAGDEKTINVTFPDEYQAEHLAGKAAEFDITVHEVKESHLPELDEELVKSFGIEDGQIDSLRTDIRGNMERELKQRLDNQVKSQVMDGLVGINEIDVPSSLVKQETDRQREQLMQQMPEGSDSNMLADELFTEQAVKRVRLGLVVGEIVQRESIRADAAAVRAQVETLASSYQDPQQVVDYYYSNPEMLNNIEGLVMEEAVIAVVLEKATVVEKPATFQEIMNPTPDKATASEGVDNESTAESS